METVHVWIDLEGTGERIRKLMRERGYTARDIQQVMGFASSRAVYKWLDGKTLPRVDNLYVLSRLLHVNIEELLAVDGEENFPEPEPGSSQQKAA